MTLEKRIVDELTKTPGLDDDELAVRLKVIRQTVNKCCNKLECRGVLKREKGGLRNKIVNTLISDLPVLGRNRPVEQVMRVPKKKTSKRTAINIDLNLLENWFVEYEAADRKLNIGGAEFSFVGAIEPERDANGEIVSYFPNQKQNQVELGYHRFGRGPFCRFRIPKGIELPGVYVIMQLDKTVYIGKTINLHRRFNSEYGQISPRNCFKGGPSTTCRINNLIYRSMREEQRLELWFSLTLHYSKLEEALLSQIDTEWNIALNGS